MKKTNGRVGLGARLGGASLLLSLATGGFSGALTGCAEDSGESSAADTDPSTLGSLALQLVVPGGIRIDAVDYVITRDGFSKSGTVDARGAVDFQTVIGGLPAGAGYTISLNATSSDGTTFTGSAKFNVTAGATSAVTVRLRGTTDAGTGSVTVTGTFNVNPVIEELSVSALRVAVGSTVSLSAVGRDPDQQPAPVTYYWSTTNGTIDTPTAAQAKLTSVNPGVATVTLTVSDGDGSASLSQDVTFVRANGVDAGAGDASTGDAGTANPSKPNVLLIIADDWGAASNSLYPELAGNSGTVPVPNLEALAGNGLVFDNAWSSPACSPTRGTIVSGQYGFRTGLTVVGDTLPPEPASLFDRVNADTSYDHALFGKYHIAGGLFDPGEGVPYPGDTNILQHARDIGVRFFKGILGGAVVDYFNWKIYDINGPAVPTKTYATTALTDLAIDYIHDHEAKSPDKPWFIYQAYNAPHAANGGNSPYQVPPANLHHVDLSAVGNPPVGSSATNIPLYKANIQALDTELGRLLKEVDLTKTTVIFIGDNGVPPPVTDQGQKIRDSKGSVYEGGVRIPLIVAGAGVTRRGREDNLFVTTDLHATVLDLAGAANAGKVNDGFSLKPVFGDEAGTSGRRHSYTEYGHDAAHQYALRDSRFKLLKNAQGWALYDLKADPQETQNLYASAAHAAVRASLETELAKLKQNAQAGYFK